MHSDYRIFDAHCDTVKMKNLYSAKTHLNPYHMKKYDGYTQVFAICIEGKREYSNAVHHIKRFEMLCKKWGIAQIKTANDLKCKKYGGILALEGAEAIANISALRLFYNKGVRLLTLTWNNDNAVASGIMAQNDKGLTPFGKRLVQECEKLGIIIDLSHIGDKGFFDVCDIIENPFICSHSNSRSVNPLAKRNITDTQFKELIKHDGVCGINLYREFLGADKNVDAVFSHIEHFCSLGGVGNIGIGSDFDGIQYLPVDCNGAKYMDTIAQKLLRNNYRESHVRGILYDNFYRVFRQVLK